MSSEKSIVDAIRRYLKSIGAKTYKMHGGPHGHAGAPDIIGAFKGRFLALEVKQPGEDATPLQKSELRGWEKAGAIAGKVESVEEVKKLIGEPN